MSLVQAMIDHKELVNGLYEVYWEDGGTSLVAVGRNAHGDVWYAPTNWVNVPSYDWEKITKVDLVAV